ncbi:MAG: gliding motility-associated C-terminal domain-containing protein, partial [Flavobacteriales bacterium]
TPDWNYFINGDALADASLELMNEGMYTVVVSSEDGACQDQSQFEISKIESPEFELPEALTFCQGDVFELQIDGLFGYTTFWNGEEQSIFKINSPGLYELRAENDCGVQMKEVEAFEEQCSCVVYTPNTFTPNNDGINDQFGVNLDCDLERYQLLVFNRWGQVVFNSIVLGELWDGSMNGSEFYVEDEVYQWQLTGQANLPTGIVDVLESGFVTVIR